MWRERGGCEVHTAASSAKQGEEIRTTNHMSTMHSLVLCVTAPLTGNKIIHTMFLQQPIFILEQQDATRSKLNLYSMRRGG